MAFSTKRPGTLVEALPEAALLNDFDGNILEANEEVCRMLGYEKEELVELTVEELTLEDAPTFTPERIDEATKAGKLETKTLRKDGTKIPVELQGRTLKLEGNKRILVTIRDITERKETERQYRDLVENALEAIFTIHPEGRFQYVNPAFEDLTGYSPEEVFREGFNFRHIVHPDDLAMVEGRREAREKGERISKSYEFRILTKNKSVKTVEATTAALPDREGLVMGILRDITERKKAKKELKQSKQKLRQYFIELAETTSRVMGVRDPYTQKHEQRVGELAK